MIKKVDGSDDSGAVWFLNRAVVVVRPKDAYRDWAMGIDSEAARAWEAEGGWTNAYLIPDFDNEDDAWDWLEAECATIFEMELGAWHDDADEWPADRSWETFLDWFDLELIEMAWDLVDEPLSSSPPEPGDGPLH